MVNALKLKYVIVTSTCHKCKDVDPLLKSKNLVYERKVIADKDEDGMEIAQKYLITTVPAFIFEDNEGLVTVKQLNEL